jgi:hypothetical protein
MKKQQAAKKAVVTPKVAKKQSVKPEAKVVEKPKAVVKVVTGEAFAKGVEALREASRSRARASRAKDSEAVSKARKLWISIRKQMGLTLGQAIEAQKQS